MRRVGNFGAGIFCLAFMVSVRPAHAYIDLAPTLSKVMSDAQRIVVIEVGQVDREKHSAGFKEVKALKGALGSPDKGELGWSNGSAAPQQIVQWAQPGARGVLFVSGPAALLCIGQNWYALRASLAEGQVGGWKLGALRPDLPLAYYGAVSRLADGIEQIQAGKDAIITTVAYGADGEGASFDLALNRANVPGLVRVQRIRARLKMPAMVMASSANPAYFVGEGRADASDVPALVAALKSPDAATRAEAAEDLGWLGKKAGGATSELTAGLKDTSPRARLAAASAQLRIHGKSDAALAVLREGLASKDGAVRRDAAWASGLAGPGASSLAERLGALLKDEDRAIRYTALQAVSTLGPAASAAAEAVVPLLDDASLSIDAADALGHIGPAGKPGLKRMAKMLESEDATIRWAAVRGMSQIGGDDAKPAVDFMIKALKDASEVDGYNMMIYLALLGPTAKDAIPAIRTARIKNPVLPTATQWAIEPDKSFPWTPTATGMWGRGPRGMGGDGGPDFARFIYENYVNELGPRLRSAAKVLAAKILEGSAGDVPGWGYKILMCSPESVEDTLAVMTPALTSDQLVQRQRATVALGYMGSAALPAKPKVEAAMKKAESDRERKLLQWCLREMAKE